MIGFSGLISVRGIERNSRGVRVSEAGSRWYFRIYMWRGDVEGSSWWLNVLGMRYLPFDRLSTVQIGHHWRIACHLFFSFFFSLYGLLNRAMETKDHIAVTW
jgi:hypothetical protein